LALFVASRLAPRTASQQTAVEQESPAEAPTADRPVVEQPLSAPAAPELKPSPVQAVEAETAPPGEPATPPASAPAQLPATVQVRLLNAFGSDQEDEQISAEVISPPALNGYRIDGQVTEAKSSGKPDGQSELKIAFRTLHGAGKAVPIAVEIQGFRNSQGASRVDENGKELKMKGGVIQRGKQLASGIGSTVGGLFGRKKNRDGSSPNAATLTARAARISFLPGSEFDLYVTQLDSD
jgi:hypothetical protein